MERSELRALIEAGPSRRLNVLEITLCQRREGGELLFRHGFLNRTILLKHLDHRARGRETRARDARRRPANMLVYFPYDPERPYDGGESMLYSRAGLRALLGARGYAASESSADALEDEAILDVLDELPALNPFLLREAFERAGRAVPDAYVALDREIAERLQRRLRRRVRPLVLAAFKQDAAAADLALDGLVEAFLRPDQSQHLRQLGSALRLDPGQAPDVLSAWAGIAFFEEELARLKSDIRDFALWLSQQTASPRGADTAALDDLRRAVRDAWAEIRTILDSYQRSYQALVFKGEPDPFVAFLRRCRQTYWRMGDLLGRFEQAVHAWRLQTAAFSRAPMPPDVLAEFLEFLGRTFLAGDEGYPIDGLAAATG